MYAFGISNHHIRLIGVNYIRVRTKLCVHNTQICGIRYSFIFAHNYLNDVCKVGKLEASFYQNKLITAGRFVQLDTDK